MRTVRTLRVPHIVSPLKKKFQALWQLLPSAWVMCLPEVVPLVGLCRRAIPCSSQHPQHMSRRLVTRFGMDSHHLLSDAVCEPTANLGVG